MMIMFVFVLTLTWQNYRKYFITLEGFTLESEVFKATKTAIDDSLILSLVVPLFENRPLRFSINITLKILLLVVFLSPILLIILYFAIDAIGLLDRIIYFVQRYDTITFLLSSRNIETLTGLDYFVNNTTLIDKLIGVGQSTFSAIFDYRRNSVEIDPFNTLFYNGFIGTLFFLSFTAGHIFLSGMIGISVGFSNALINRE